MTREGVLNDPIWECRDLNEALERETARVNQDGIGATLRNEVISAGTALQRACGALNISATSDGTISIEMKHCKAPDDVMRALLRGVHYEWIREKKDE